MAHHLLSHHRRAGKDLATGYLNTYHDGYQMVDTSLLYFHLFSTFCYVLLGNFGEEANRRLKRRALVEDAKVTTYDRNQASQKKSSAKEVRQRPLPA